MAAKEDKCEEIVPAKKMKLNSKESDEIDGSENDDVLIDFSDFVPEKILTNNANRKTVCVLGSFQGKEGQAIILLEKKSFTDVEVSAKNGGYFSKNSKLKNLLKNDIYGSYECFPDISINCIKATVIHPATEKHIEKYSIKNLHIINETPDLYNTITLPHINDEQFDIKWVYNILEHKTETERIIFEDPDKKNGFILLPDLKWDGKTFETLYLLAVIHQKDIKSLRDLNSSHLPLLKNIYDKGTKAIEDIYHLSPSQLRIYLHYQPSFYHLHVHFTYLKYEAPGIYAEKSHMLANVISNIELVSDYYQRITLPFVVSEQDNLFKKYHEKGILKKMVNS